MTGKRAKAPTRCINCDRPISGDFLRERKGDRHIVCPPHGKKCFWCGATDTEEVRPSVWQCLNERCKGYGKAQAL